MCEFTPSKLLAILTVIILVVAGGYLFWTYVLPNSFLCSSSGIGSIPCNYDASFILSVNYNGSWTALYYGYHGNPEVFTSNGSITSGKFSGTGSENKSVTLTAPNTYGLGVCLRAQKLDTSASNLTVSVQEGAFVRSNSTSVPLGTIYICVGVYP